MSIVMPAVPTRKRVIRTLIVDDSALVRRVFTDQLQRDPRIEVVGTAPDPIVAGEMIIKLKPDVITLDVEMPRMDGITFLRQLMHQQPMPVIVVSSMTPKGGTVAMQAFEAGAVDVMCKPGRSYSIGNMGDDLIRKIVAASCARLAQPSSASSQFHVSPLSMPCVTDKIFALGASTGGVEALTQIITAFPANAPATLVVEHMPAQFTKSFADRLNSLSAMEVKEAGDGDSVNPGRVLIAPGGYHMVLCQAATKYFVAIKDGPKVRSQKPSVEVLFQSVARVVGAKSVAALLTGMGADGAEGLLAIRAQGGRTIAQDQASSVVFGMPKEAIALDAAQNITPLGRVAALMISLASR